MLCKLTVYASELELDGVHQFTPILITYVLLIKIQIGINRYDKFTTLILNNDVLKRKNQIFISLGDYI